MSTEDIIIRLFLIVDDRISSVKKRSDANLYPSEIVTIGLLFALKGGKFSPFYRWLSANYGYLFPNLPEHSRLTRLLRDYSPYAEQFFADPSFFTVIDTFGIELIHPRREGRSKQQIGKKGVSNGRWIVGIKLAWLLNREGVSLVGIGIRLKHQITPFVGLQQCMMVRQLHCVTMAFEKRILRRRI